MSPTDKGGSTPESPETPDQPGGATPDETTPVEPIAGETAPVEPAPVELTKAETPAAPVVGEPAEPVAGAPTENIAAPGSAPLGGEYPAPDAFAPAGEAPKNNKKVYTIVGVVAIVVVAAVAALLAVLFTGDDPVDPEAQIKAVTETFVAINNSGKVSEVLPIACKAAVEQLPAELPDQPPAANPVTIKSIDDIKITGDTATAVVTVSIGDAPDAPTNPVPLTYANEDGWKVC